MFLEGSSRVSPILMDPFYPKPVSGFQKLLEWGIILAPPYPVNYCFPYLYGVLEGTPK